MSRIGKLPITVPAGVDVKINDNVVTVKGKLGEMTQVVDSLIEVKVEEATITLSIKEDTKEANSKHGLYRSLINNMVVGVTDGYSKQLNIVGVGYKVELKGKNLVLNLGHSHSIDYPAPDGVEFDVDPKKNTIVVKGANKECVGQTAAEIRSFRPPEPYKGKGVMYSTERIRRKAGKAAAGKGK